MDLYRRVPPGTYPAADFPEYPARVLTDHLIAKSLQVGSVLGLVLTPFRALAGDRCFASAFHRSMLTSTAFGFVATFGLTAKLYYEGKLTDEGVDDRAYRLSKSIGQRTVDNFSFFGGVAGIGCGSILGKYGLRSIAAYGLAGAALGTFAYGVKLEKETGFAQQKVQELQKQVEGAVTAIKAKLQ